MRLPKNYRCAAAETLFLGPVHTNADIFETAYRRLHLSVDNRQKEHVFSNRVADLRCFVAKHLKAVEANCRPKLISAFRSHFIFLNVHA